MAKPTAPVDFTIPAVAFWSSRPGMPSGRRPLKTKRFPSLSDAVQFLVEDKTEPRFAYTVETDDADFSGHDIDQLYQRNDFPKPFPT